MTDIQLARALEAGQIANKDFHHAAHLHVAWAYLSECMTPERAAKKMSNTLRNFAAAAGKPGKYHETLTVFWVRILALLRAANAPDPLEKIVERHPELLEKNYPLIYYSPEQLFSDTARASWIAPDKIPLREHATARDSSRSTGNP
jgi:hypothetical protein